MRLADRQYWLGTALQRRTGTLTLFTWKFQKEAVVLDTDLDKALSISSGSFGFSCPLASLPLAKKPRKGGKRQLATLYLSNK